MFRKVSLILLIGLTILTQNVNSARILAIVPTASYSHQVFYQQLWRELAIRGHDMVIITSDPTGEQLANFKEVSIKETYPLMKIGMDMLINENMINVILSNKMNQMILELSEFQLALPQIQEILHNKTEHFDLMIAEHLAPTIFGFKHRFNCSLIGVASMDALSASHEIMGNAVHSVMYPIPLLPFTENLTLVQRLMVVIVDKVFMGMMHLAANQLHAMMKKHFGPDTPDMYEVLDGTDMLFVNANPVFSPVRPHTPSTISIAGGIHMKPLQPLPKDLKQFLDNANEGVIYFSFGSNVRSNELSLELRQTIMETLSQVPYKVLWKFEDDSLPGKPDNVKITKWAPQQDILRHANVKLFITQGGLQSLEEALYSHVPLVVIPFFGDQQGNSAKVEAKGMGVVLDRHNLKVEEFKTAILEVIGNPMYRNKVKELADRIQDEPMKPLDKAVWWTEYVLRHKGAKHLKGPRIPLYQYYYFDIFAVVGLVVVVLVALIFGIVKLIVKTVKCMFKCQMNTKKVKKS